MLATITLGHLLLLSKYIHHATYNKRGLLHFETLEYMSGWRRREDGHLNGRFKDEIFNVLCRWSLISYTNMWTVGEYGEVLECEGGLRWYWPEMSVHVSPVYWHETLSSPRRRCSSRSGEPLMRIAQGAEPPIWNNNEYYSVPQYWLKCG